MPGIHFFASVNYSIRRCDQRNMKNDNKKNQVKNEKKEIHPKLQPDIEHFKYEVAQETGLSQREKINQKNNIPGESK